VPPFEFICIAEECRLIGELGDYVLSMACRDFMLWRADLGPHTSRLLAVHLSRAQLAVKKWIANIRTILQASGMPAEQRQLAVTESLAAQDEAIQASLREFKEIGIKLALDDFGTGYSSLSCLHQLPVETVKIGRSFVC
jgi:EAL domain-containing protein (putative c-di-GMP-specific phosphodiesterase class I)